MNRFFNLSLKLKLYIAFTMIFVFVGTLAIVANFSMKDITSGYKKITNIHYQNIRDAEKLKTMMLELRKNEKDFLTTKDKKYTELHVKNFDKVENILKDLKKNLPDSFIEQINLISKNVSAYNAGIEKVKLIVEKEGNSKNGIRGELRATSHKIESFIKNNNLKDSYLVTLLTFRRREKDFLLRRDNKYLTKLKSDISKVNTKLDASTFSKKDTLKSLIGKYLQEFEDLTKNESKLVSVKDEFEKNIYKVETLTDDLILKSLGYLNNEKKAIRSEINMVTTFFLGLSAFIGLIIFFIGAYTRKLILNLVQNVESLKHVSSLFGKTSDTIVNSSDELKNLTTNQSSSIQETASSVNEITAMVSKNSKSAQSSQKKSEENSTAASKGKRTVENVIEAMNVLLKSSNLMNERFEKTSSELEDIVSIINQIGDKTKVINDIVFQTKLLSFNASVEAARAGENGKGFAVVAEEVGNLANMSGTSAEEITKILDESINKVSSLVESNKQEMNKMIEQNNVNVNKGINTARDCEKVLNSIIKNVSDINVSIGEIAHASKEQDVGVKEISQAINTLNDSNHKVTLLAGQSRDHADSMEDGVKSILGVAKSIELMVQGKVNENPQEITSNDKSKIESNAKVKTNVNESKNKAA